MTITGANKRAPDKAVKSGDPEILRPRFFSVHLVVLLFLPFDDS